MSNLRDHAIREMELAKVDEDIYGDMTSKAVLKMIDVFESEGHSGMSASLVLSIFNRVVNFRNLTPLTNDPAEWYQHGEGNWQNMRDSSAFSADEGRTYYLTGEVKWETDEHDRRYMLKKYYQTEHTYTAPRVDIIEPEEASDGKDR